MKRDFIVIESISRIREDLHTCVYKWTDAFHRMSLFICIYLSFVYICQQILDCLSDWRNEYQVLIFYKLKKRYTAKKTSTHIL